MTIQLNKNIHVGQLRKSAKINSKIRVYSLPLIINNEKGEQTDAPGMAMLFCT
jgi:hypothetical protein